MTPDDHIDALDALNFVPLSTDGLIMRSPQADAFAEIAFRAGVPHVVFRTILENGRIVETLLRSGRPTYDVGHWDTSLTDEEREGALIIRGEPEWLSGADHPWGGLYSETLEAPVRALWGRHCQRLESIAGGRELPTHGDELLYDRITQRVSSIRRTHAAIAHGSFWAVLGTLALLGAAGIVAVLGQTPPGALSLTLWASGLYVTHDVARLAWPHRAGARIASLLPLPRVVPLRKLRPWRAPGDPEAPA